MIVMLSLNKCPIGLRGDLTKWFLEIGTGVYVGNLSARIRDLLWKRVCERCGPGEAIMVFSARNEQGYSFYTHNMEWKSVDYDGIMLLKKPLPVKAKGTESKNYGGSEAEKRNIIKHTKKVQLSPVDITEKVLKADIEPPLSFIALDLETTGLRSKEDDIVEVAVVRYEQGRIVEKYHTLVNSERRVPEAVITLTGINNELLNEQGAAIKGVLAKVQEFIGDHVLVGHHTIFDLRFLKEACNSCDMDMKQYRYIDTVMLSKALCHEAVENNRLETLVRKFSIADRQVHRALPDAILTAELYLKLIENQNY